jgi:hypothetical protein
MVDQDWICPFTDCARGKRYAENANMKNTAMRRENAGF